jgi:hypothetical protein
MFKSPQIATVSLEGTKVLAHAFNTADCLNKHGNSRFCTCLITVALSSPFPLFTGQQFLVPDVSVLTSSPTKSENLITEF